MSTGEIVIQILQVRLEIFHRLTLGHVVRIVFKVSQPHIVILPEDIPNAFHVSILAQFCWECNHILDTTLTFTLKMTAHRAGIL